MATVTHDDLVVCIACALLMANGPCDGCESCVFSDAQDCPNTAGERMAERWDWPLGLTLTGDDVDPYSARECDGCGSTDHGERHSAVMFAR